MALERAHAARPNRAGQSGPADFARPSAALAQPSTSSPAPVIHFGPVILNGGRVDFTDRFIKPNFSARLTELTGKLSAFSSQAPNGEVQLADLAKVAKALQARPALKMTVVGTASLELERDAFKREQLQALVLAEKRRAQPGVAATATGPVSAEEYPALLKVVYKRANFPKPRNLIGLAKELPVPEMEALLLANLSATESAMQELAVRCGVVVRDHLSSLKLPLERLLLGAAKAVPPEAKWQSRAELSLASE